MTGWGSLRDRVQLLATGGPHIFRIPPGIIICSFFPPIFFFLNRGSEKHCGSCEHQHLQRRACPESHISSLCKTHSRPCRQIHSHKSVAFLRNGHVSCFNSGFVAGDLLLAGTQVLVHKLARSDESGHGRRLERRGIKQWVPPPFHAPAFPYLVAHPSRKPGDGLPQLLAFVLALHTHKSLDHSVIKRQIL